MVLGRSYKEIWHHFATNMSIYRCFNIATFFPYLIKSITVNKNLSPILLAYTINSVRLRISRRFLNIHESQSSLVFWVPDSWNHLRSDLPIRLFKTSCGEAQCIYSIYYGPKFFLPVDLICCSPTFHITYRSTTYPLGP